MVLFPGLAAVMWILLMILAQIMRQSVGSDASPTGDGNNRGFPVGCCPGSPETGLRTSRISGVPLEGPHTGSARKASGLCLAGRVNSANRAAVSR